MSKYRVKVETRGKLIFFKNRKIRTPFTLTIDESEVDLLKIVMMSQAISDYELERITDDVKEESWEDTIINPKKEETVIEELIEEVEEPTTLLGKLLRDEKNGE